MADKLLNISQVTHPDYDAHIADWERYRYAYKGGKDFVEKYVVQFSSRESNSDYIERLDLSYCPAFAKAAVNEIKNAIYQRMVDVTRRGGPKNYQLAVKGEKGGIDFTGNTMTGYIGRLVLPELLSIGKVGVYVDKSKLGETLTINQVKAINKHPYIYLYTAEAIKSWVYDSEGRLLKVLLEDVGYLTDKDFGLPHKQVLTYRLMEVTNDGILVTFFDSTGNMMGIERLKLKEIPLTILEISDSLMVDVVDYQIALANLASSDMWYSIKANFPFYTEMYNPHSDLAAFQRNAQAQLAIDADLDTYSEATAGSADNAKVAKDLEIKVGATQGRRYAKGLERPGFINPSSEPIKASMDKQEQLKEEIRQLVNLTVANLSPRKASAESKAFDERTLESGLSYIGLELEHAERQIAYFWSLYENDEPAHISYPINYSLKTKQELQDEAAKDLATAEKIPSITFKKEIFKQAASTLIGSRVSVDTINKITNEIDTARVLKSDSETILAEHEAGLVGDQLASELCGYPVEEVEKAKKDHAERAVRILNAQISARGIPDLSNANAKDSTIKEKKESQAADVNPDAQKKAVRGKA